MRSRERRYQTVSVSIWDDPDFRAMANGHEDARQLFLYLLTCKHLNLLGMFVIPKAYAMHDLNWTMRRTEAAFNDPVLAKMIQRDPETDVVLLLKRFKHSPLDTENKVKGAVQALNEVPATHLDVKLIEIIEKLGKGIEWRTLVHAIRMRCASNTLSVSSKQYPETETDTDTDPPATDPVLDEQAMFDEFWKQYPRHEAKKKARDSFGRISPDQELFDQMMAGLATWKESDQWRKDGGKFIPHPTTWLNGRRWEDEGIQPGYASDDPEPRTRQEANDAALRRAMGKAKEEVNHGDEGSGGEGAGAAGGGTTGQADRGHDRRALPEGAGPSS